MELEDNKILDALDILYYSKDLDDIDEATQYLIQQNILQDENYEQKDIKELREKYDK